MKKLFFSSALILLAILCLPKPSSAEKFFVLEAVPLVSRVDATNTPDWSVSSPLGSLKLTFPNGLEAGSYVTMTDIASKDGIKDLFPYPENLTPTDDMYTIRMESRGQTTLAGTKLTLKYVPDNTFKHAYYYNKETSEFLPLDCSNDVKGNLITCQMPDTAEISLAIFSEAQTNGLASWYVNGKYMNSYIAASTDFPINSVVKVTNLDNNKSITVTIKDYGPKKCSDWTAEEQRKMGPCRERVLDLSKVAFQKISLISQGIAKVKVEPIN
jgi:hypothetical protein